MDFNENRWYENTGVVPEGVGPNTLIETEYVDGYVAAWKETKNIKNNNPELWLLQGNEEDVKRWRFI